MTDIPHDPRTDWCACEPGAVDRCGYRLLADAVIAALNPRDGDEAEVSLCVGAVERIAAYVTSLDCECTESDDDGPCERCEALGQWHGRPLIR